MNYNKYCSCEKPKPRDNTSICENCNELIPLPPTSTGHERGEGSHHTYCKKCGQGFSDWEEAVMPPRNICPGGNYEETRPKPTPQPTSEWEFKFDFVESLDRPLVIKRVRELLRQERQAGRDEALYEAFDKIKVLETMGVADDTHTVLISKADALIAIKRMKEAARGVEDKV